MYARRFFFSYKVIKKTESKESLADLLEHSETRASFFYLSLSILTTRGSERQRSNSNSWKRVRQQASSYSRSARVLAGEPTSKFRLPLQPLRIKRLQKRPHGVRSKIPESAAPALRPRGVNVRAVMTFGMCIYHLCLGLCSSTR